MADSITELGKLLARLRECLNVLDNCLTAKTIDDDTRIRLTNTVVVLEVDIAKLTNKVTVELLKQDDSSRKRRAS